jgi:tetraacyldisaccharide 4'-kinase
LYGALLALRRRAYRSGVAHSASAGKPVVVVGNLTVGGTGKTPLTVWLARALREQGLRVGIVARGYGSHDERAARRVAANSRWQQVGDEPLILARRAAARQWSASTGWPRPACSRARVWMSSCPMTACSICAWRAIARSW